MRILAFWPFFVIMKGVRFMYSYKSEDVIYQADTFIQRNTNLREVAKYLGISKSLLHYNLTIRLLEFDFKRHEYVRKILDRNKAERHIRGGAATRLKYLKNAKD